MRVSIERMRLEDLDDVTRIDRQSFPTPWRPETFRDEILQSGRAYYVVARAHFPQGMQTVGFAGMWLVLDEAHITTIGVDPACRGRKVGERLLLDLLRHATDTGIARVTLEVRESNLVAQKLYLKYCFGAVGMRRGYYSDTGENAIIMWIENLHDPALQRFLDERRRALDAAFGGGEERPIAIVGA